jgi:hypothetical protein
MSRTLRLVFVLLAALIIGLLGAPAAQAVGTNTVVVHATDPDGGPVAITIWKYVGGNGAGNNSATGDYTWSGIEDGDYTFAVQATSMDGYQLWYDGTASGSPTQPSPTHLGGGQTVNITLQFPRLATLSGTLKTSDGDPVPNVAVGINRGGTVRNAHTDASGVYTFGYLRSGAVTIYTGTISGWVAATPEIITIPASGTATQNLTLTKAGSIAGSLVNDADSEPVAGVEVTAWTKASLSYAGTAHTDASGHFQLDGLGAGAHLLRYSDPWGGSLRSTWWSGNQWTSTGAAAIAVTEGATTTSDERLVYPDPAGYSHALSGTITDGTGAALAGIEVTAAQSGDSATAVTDRNGRWALSVAAGSWTVHAQSSTTRQASESATPWYPQYYAASGSADTAAAADHLSVVDGAALDGLNLALARSARLRVEVTTPSGDGVSPGWRLATPAGVELPAPPTDATGYPLLRPGSYKLLVTGEAAGQALLPRWYGNAASAADATTVTVTAGDDPSGSVSLASGLATVAAPSVSGTARVGSVLNGITGTWNLQTATTYALRWKRGATLVGSAATYTVRPADAGSALTFAVTATNTAFGRSFSTTASKTVTIAKVASKTTLKTKALGGRKVRVSVVVAAAGLVPSGTVTIRRGSVVVARVKLSHGKATLTMKRQPAGNKTYRATFNGSTQLLTSVSGTRRVRVR